MLSPDLPINTEQHHAILPIRPVYAFHADPKGGFNIDSALLPPNTPWEMRWTMWPQTALEELQRISPGLLAFDGPHANKPGLPEEAAVKKGRIQLLSNPGVPFLIGTERHRTKDLYVVAGDVDVYDRQDYGGYTGKGLSQEAVMLAHKVVNRYMDHTIKHRDDPNGNHSPHNLGGFLIRLASSLRGPGQDLRLRNAILAAKLREAYTLTTASSTPMAVLVGASHMDISNSWNKPNRITRQLTRTFRGILEDLKETTPLLKSPNVEALEALCYFFGYTTIWKIAPPPESMRGVNRADLITHQRSFVSSTITDAMITAARKVYNLPFNPIFKFESEK